MFRTLHSLATTGLTFFLQLGVNNFAHIQSNSTSVDDAFVLGLQKWIKGTDVSRKELLKAVFNPAGGNNQKLARTLANSFKGFYNHGVTLRHVHLT